MTIFKPEKMLSDNSVMFFFEADFSKHEHISKILVNTVTTFSDGIKS